MSELTDKREDFSQLVVKYGNQSKAYREAFDVGKDTKDTTVWNDAYKLMQNPDVIARVEELRKEQSNNHGVDTGWVIRNLKEVIDDVNYTVDLAKLEKADSDETKRFYKLKEVTTNTDKLRAIDMLTKMLGLNAPDKIEQDIKIEIIEKKRD